jgi:iron complex transport system ATP-binding protein
MSFFSVDHLRAGYGKKNILSDISFSLKEGHILGVLGANGCGKTTLLKCLCGILPHGGECTLLGERLEKLSAKQIAQRCSYIPQRSGIAIEISSLDVVLMGFNPKLRLLEHPNEEMKQKAKEALALVGLKGRENENYLSLSEGQKQLCILARTLVSDANLLLLDEPESALDFRFRYQTLAILKAWVAQKQRGAVVTLHDGALALNDCDELLLLSDGKVLGTVRPKTDPLEKTEEMLSRIYGSISLQRCFGKDGREHIVMIKEAEA